MLLHHVTAAAPGVDIEQVVCRFPGRLDIHRLQRAWQRTLETHEVLRNGFTVDSSGLPWQQPAPVVHVRIQVERQDGSEAHQPDAQLAAYLQADRTRAFDLAVAPLMRWTVIPADAGDILVWTFHHVLLDGRSFPLVLDEVFGQYDGDDGTDRVPAARRRPFRDFCTWLHGRDWATSEGFWRTRLAGFTAPTQLALPAPDGPDAAAGHDEIRIDLPESDTDALTRFAEAIGVTPNTVVQGAWALLLHHYSRESDVVFGATRACRRGAIDDAEGMIGLLINTVPMRVTIDRAMPLASWLAGLRDDWRALRDHELTPLALVQQWSEVPRGQSLFTTLVVYEHQTLDGMMRARGGAWTGRQVEYHGQTNFDVTLTAYGGRVLHLRLGYYRDRLGTGQARRMLGHLRTLLGAMPSRATTPVGDIPFQTDADRVATLALSNETDVDYGEPEHLLAAFEACAARHPDAAALTFRDETTSYGDLDRGANRLAHLLRARGVTPGQRVAVCLERSSDLLLALYGVLKAGCAYVPVDPDYPADRVAFMLADAEPALVIVDRPDRIPATGVAAPIFAFDRERAALAGMSSTRPDVLVDPSQPAYMIYTSGSTGRPKGAPNSHRGIVNRLWWMQHEYRLTPADAVLQKTPFSFDVSVWELFWPLMVGARLVIAEPGGHRDPQYLIRTIDAERITVVHFVPSMLRVFLSAPDVGRCTSLREVICSGEALPPDLVDQCHAALPATVRNLYGPTEAAVDVTHWTCPRGGPTSRVPIGRPVANTRCYILDDRGVPVPRGVPGELYIAGVQVGLGYHNRPDLTAERFLADPFASRPGARMYRTGDLCRHLEDGAIEYLGRLDHQVKIRGFRIELGEIEAALSALPTIHEAVVMAREDEPGDRRIVAYVVAQGTATGLVDLWRAALAATLPEYMLPQHFVVLAELPLSPNGKVDRKRLPRPVVDRGPASEGLAPSSVLERQIAAIWSEVLGVPHVGVRDNFFEAGGQSLKLMQVHHQLRVKLDFDIPIVTLFQHPTIASLSEVLAARGTGGTAAPAVDTAVTDRAARQRAAAARMKSTMGKGR